MAVLTIKECRMQNGMDILKVYTKPTKEFPSGGCFYTDAQAIELVQSYGWYLAQYGKYGIYVVACGRQTNCKFHRELCKLYLGYYADYVDHIDMVEFDNVDINLNIVMRSQNKFNTFTKGYYYNGDNYFKARIQLNNKIYYPFSAVHREDEMCIQRNDVEQNWLREKMQDDYYMFDFKKYRRGSEDILDLERTGIISEDEATYQHILKYADNAWYYLRFGLQDYFKDNHIPIPKYDLDENGFMVHHITGEKLCPL